MLARHTAAMAVMAGDSTARLHPLERLWCAGKEAEVKQLQEQQLTMQQEVQSLSQELITVNAEVELQRKAQQEAASQSAVWETKASELERSLGEEYSRRESELQKEVQAKVHSLIQDVRSDSGYVCRRPI